MKVEILRRDCPSRSPHFNPLRPCGRRHLTCISANNVMCISIHSARVGGDVNYSGELQNALIFQSTPPVWAETVSALGSAGSCIHFNPLRPCGRRHQRAAACLGCWNFNPLRPCGRRPKGYSYVEKRAEIFQSTPPVWAETLQTGSTIYWPGFQSTPPVWAETAKETIFSSLKHLYYNIFYRKKQENSM